MNEAQQRTADLLQSKGFTLTPKGDFDFKRLAEFSLTVERVSVNEDGTVRGSISGIPETIFSKLDPQLL